jgi:uncharacterized protein (DUF1697 family)
MGRLMARAIDCVALFRGLNVGGKNLIAMRDLTALFTDAGCEHARAYIQSGNVLFRAAPALVKTLPSKIAAAVEKRAGVRTTLTLRTRAELERVVAQNPFLPKRAPESLHVYFLADAPSAAAARALDPARSPPDEFQVRGREIYLHLPNGMGRTKLSNAYFDGKLATITTARNWRTVTTLLSMLSTP